MKKFLLLLPLLFLVCFPVVLADDSNLAGNYNFWGYPYNSGFGLNRGDYTTAQYPIVFDGGNTMWMYRSSYYISHTGWGWTGISEIDGMWIAVNPGDEIVLKAKVWTTPSSEGCTHNYHGACLGADMYSNYGRIVQINPHWDGTGVPCADDDREVFWDWEIAHVPFNSSGWVQLSVAWTIENSYESDGFGYYSEGTNVAPAGFIPWFGLGGDTTNEEGQAYIKDVEIYVNPSSFPAASPTPTPVPPTPTPTATPTYETLPDPPFFAMYPNTEQVSILPPQIIILAVITILFGLVYMMYKDLS